jgi:hypothetical protein
MTTSLRSLAPLIAGAFLLLACASAPERRLWAESAEPALVTQSGAFEIHVRGGKVVKVVPATEPGRSATVREIDDIAELRELYVDAVGEPLPEDAHSGRVELNGWLGLECVRQGHACGRAPEEVPRALIVLRFR